MKIVTWNVNGLRAALRKGILDWVLDESPDILCLQETRVRPDQLKEEQRNIPGYQIVWNPAERAGYSGVATWTREAPQEIEVGMGAPRFDVEGRVIRTRHPGFFLYNIYFPNGQRGHERVEYKLDFYAHLLDTCDALHAAGESVIITGDFNTAHREIDLRNPKENANTSGFLPEERAWIDRYLEHGFVEVYRHLYPDREQYTWWTYRFNARQRNVGWRIDYFLVSESLLPRVQDVIIHDDVLGSDHCPVALLID
ncbi:MAG: exodeoxyribonuclease III [Chloroflexi bacterium]|nr:exodeoxyribonuclease III [Chloroflexota bacterium]